MIRIILSTYFYKNLTLTRVVFEFVIKPTVLDIFIYLTLTRVVFELQMTQGKSPEQLI